MTSRTVGIPEGTVTSPARRARRWQPSADAKAILILVVLPILAFGGPALFGHSVLPGDDLTQNFPLRVLVGADLRHGHLPVFDPYIWSGAPLLGGWNAGAAYPLTWLFVFLPGSLAWSIGLIVTSWAAGVGTFVFLRAARLGTVPSWLGALSFAFTGAMTMQIVHFGLVAGMGWVPLELLAVLRLSEDRSLVSRVRWTAVFAVCFALTILAGEPRAIDDAVVIVGLYALWRIVRLGRRSAWLFGSTVVGTALGVGLGAVQWAPGIAAVSSSQRAAAGYYLFSSGSLSVKWLVLLGVPDVLGGSGSFGQPPFFASYNLTEVTGYVGVLPLVAAFVLLGRLRLRRPVPEYAVWLVVAVVGIFLALGGNTPLWHLLIHIPLFGSQRLQSRNILVTDFALAALLAYWADAWLGARRRSAPDRRRLGLDTALGMGVALVVAGIVVAALTWGAGFTAWLGTDRRQANVTGGLQPWLVPWLVLGILAVALIVAGPRMPWLVRRRMLVGFVVADVVIFNLFITIAVASGLGGSPPLVKPTSVLLQPAPASAAVPVSSLHIGGRFAVYDPDLLDGNQLSVLGAPDLNVTTDTPSVLGYSSIVDGLYAAVTGAHEATGGGQDIFSPQAASDGALDELDTAMVFTPASYLITHVGSTAPAPGSGTGDRHLAAGTGTTWYFGTTLSVTSIAVPDSDPDAASLSLPAGVRFGLLTPSGRTVWLRSRTRPGHLEARLHHRVDAVGLVAEAGTSAVSLGTPTIATSSGDAYVADGQLQGVMVPPHWRFAGTDGAFAMFRDTRASPLASLRALPGAALTSASLRVVTRSDGIPSAVAVSSPSGVQVVRSVADIPGWRATWTPAGSKRSTSLPVRHSGIVQAVTVPAGNGVLAWRYDAPRFHVAKWVSAAAFVLLLSLIAVGFRRRVASRPD